tara:strand:- start:221 stop:1036 length:816 start_codon:yes stop_codon:yes gene_type:complete
VSYSDPNDIVVTIRRFIVKTNLVLKKIRSREQTIGCFLGLGSPNVAELLAHSGFDWLVVETEHNGLDSAEIEQMLTSINVTETIPIVRVPSSDKVYTQRALDMGAMGVIVPMVKSAEEVSRIVQQTKYPPYGTRSWGPLRASQYTIDNEDYFEKANDNIIVGIILETVDALNDLENIISVPGLNVIVVGPWDLALSLGLDPRKLPLPEIDEIVERVVHMTSATQVVVGSGSATPDGLKVLNNMGVRFLSYGPDYALLVNSAKIGLDVFSKL